MCRTWPAFDASVLPSATESYGRKRILNDSEMVSVWVPSGSFGFLRVPSGSFGFLRVPWLTWQTPPRTPNKTGSKISTSSR